MEQLGSGSQNVVAKPCDLPMRLPPCTCRDGAYHRVMRELLWAHSLYALCWKRHKHGQQTGVGLEGWESPTASAPDPQWRMRRAPARSLDPCETTHTIPPWNWNKTNRIWYEVKHNTGHIIWEQNSCITPWKAAQLLAVSRRAKSCLPFLLPHSGTRCWPGGPGQINQPSPFWPQN